MSLKGTDGILPDPQLHGERMLSLHPGSPSPGGMLSDKVCHMGQEKKGPRNQRFLKKGRAGQGVKGSLFSGLTIAAAVWIQFHPSTFS